MEFHRLEQLQSLSLRDKVARSERKIREWYYHHGGQVYIAFSGGKDSTVLLHLVRSLFPDVPAVFIDTGLEYPEIRDFVKAQDNVTWLRPKMGFKAVLEKYGYPVVSKEQAQCIYELRTMNISPQVREKWLRGKGRNSGRRRLSEKWHYLLDAPFPISNKCCDVMKKGPANAYSRRSGRHRFTGEMACDSFLRTQQWARQGCNAFEGGHPKSVPLAFWTEPDVWGYLGEKGVPYSRIYDMGFKRTGCMFCMFGVHMESGENRFQKMCRTHPKQWRYCMEELGLREVLEHLGVLTEPVADLFD